MQWTWASVLWGVAALALLAGEALAPGVAMMWLGFAAAAVFAVVFVFPGMSLLAQAALFVALSWIAILAYRRWFLSREPASDRPALNRRAEQLVGRVVPLDRAIVNGTGRVQIADAFWDVSGPELPAGTPVRITGADGMTLVVEPLG